MLTDPRTRDLMRRATQAARDTVGASWRAERWSVAPGRIELVGNHVDYNGGPVLAGAIDRVIVAGRGPGPDAGRITVVAPDVTSEADAFDPTAIGDWHAGPADVGPGAYLRGLVAALAARRIPIRNGMALAVAGDIPPGFGMSSSAALCIATLLLLTDAELSPQAMVAIAREAEHRAGSPVGAMDQSASVAGGVILFDGRDASYTPITPELGEHVFAVVDSGVDRSLRSSSYPRRVQESHDAAKAIAEVLGQPIQALAEVPWETWTAQEATIRARLGETLYRRARHVITEVHRVRQAEAAMRRGDWPTFGRLMNASGASSANDYEISHPRVEELVAALRLQDGVLGARMMGGGEGGPALALLHRDAVEAVSAAVERDYFARYPIRRSGPRVQVCVFGPGAHREDA